jgi:hypothetical protein
MAAQSAPMQSAPLEMALLPNAPSSLMAEIAEPQFSGTAAGKPQPPRSALPIVNGRPYRKPTAKDNLRYYEHSLFGPRAFVSAAIRSGIEQARDVPVEWGQDFPGYIQRYGSAYGEYAIDDTVRYGLSSALHEDLHYRICHLCSAGEKFENAFLSEVTARRGDDGHRVVSATPLIADFSGPAVAYAAWYPPEYTEGDAAKHAFLQIGIRFVVNVAREFLFDHDKTPKYDKNGKDVDSLN